MSPSKYVIALCIAAFAAVMYHILNNACEVEQGYLNREQNCRALVARRHPDRQVRGGWMDVYAFGETKHDTIHYRCVDSALVVRL